MSTESPHEAESAQHISKEDAYREARDLVRARHHGVLSTLSKREGGWPFGSVVPYGLSARGEPILYLARIAEHYRNIDADERVSLLVHDGAELEGQDVQVRGRATLMGRARRVPAEDLDDAWARYRARLPQAESYSRTHGFELFVVALEKVRYIGGFGKIFWLDHDRFLLDPAKDPLRDVAAMVIEHMNQDHRDALLTYCQAFAELSPAEARLVGVDAFGMDVEARGPDLRLRFEFPAPASPQSIRQATIELLHRARSRLAAR